MNHTKHILIAILLTSLLCGSAAAWLTGYDHRMPITVNNGGASELTHYQFNFTNDTNILVAAGQMQASGADCRITDASDNLIPFWNETAFNAAGTKIWANATSLAVGDNTFYMYYGNSGASSVINGANTFQFFDGFDVDTAVIELIPEPSNPTRSADDAWEGTQVNEQSDFHYGGEYISWYRGHGSGTYEVGFENSSDGITWTPYAGNPILNAPNVYVYAVQDGNNFYLFTNTDPTANGNGNMYLYNVTDYTNPGIMNDGNPVYTRSTTSSDWDWKIFNPAVTIDSEGVWHMLLEGQSDAGVFRIGYAHSNLTEMNWSAHRSSSYVIGLAQSGNPDLIYVPDRNAVFSLHGERSGYGNIWRIVASYACLSDDLSLAASWHKSSNFLIEESGIHIADPSTMFNFNETYPTMISYNFGQVGTYQLYSSLTLNEFYDAIASASPLSEKWQSTNMGLYSTSGGNLVLNASSTNTHCLNSKNNFTNFVVESRVKAVGTQPCEICCQMDAALATTTPLTERTAVRLSDTFLVSINGFCNQVESEASDTWYRLKMIIPSTGDAGAYIYSDAGNLIADKTGAPASTTSYIALWQGESNYGYVDWAFVRQYTTVEPTATLGTAESDAGGGGAYNITLLTGWNIIGWTPTAATTAHSMGGLIGGNCTYIIERNATTGEYVNHNMAGPEGEDNFAILRGWGYFVDISAETFWERAS